jgi:hypothetical protein
MLCGLFSLYVKYWQSVHYNTALKVSKFFPLKHQQYLSDNTSQRRKKFMEILLGNKNSFWPIKDNNGCFFLFISRGKYLSISIRKIAYFKPFKIFSTWMDKISQSDFSESFSDRRSFQKANSKINVWEGSLKDHFWVAQVDHVLKDALELFKMKML